MLCTHKHTLGEGEGNYAVENVYVSFLLYFSSSIFGLGLMRTLLPPPSGLLYVQHSVTDKTSLHYVIKPCDFTNLILKK